MAIPDKPLVLDLDLEELTLDEIAILYAETYSLVAFRQFLLDHVDHTTSWTRREIGQIKRKELNEVMRQVIEKVVERSVPLAS